MRALAFPIPGKSAVLCLMALSLLSLTGCRNDRVDVNTKDPHAPKYAYRLDELALLHMAADDIQDMERKKQYGQIYDEYGSDDFKNGVSRRRFLIMSNCVETYLGGLEEFDTNDLGFRRETVKGSRSPLDVLNRKVQRIQGSIEEQLVFVPSGLNFKLNGLYWIAKDKTFLQCIADSPKVEAATQPAPPEGANTTQTPPDSAAEQPNATENGQTASSPEAHKPTQAPATDQSDGSAPIPAPVQDMQPSEIKKAPIQARPAGAGAVIDERPVAKKSKPVKTDAAPGNSDSKSSNTQDTVGPPVPSAAEHTQPAMPLPIPPDEPRH